jgi:hypothetical protein
METPHPPRWGKSRMRIFDIIPETAGDTWDTRFADHQRQQQRRTATKTKIAKAKAAGYRQQRAAADRQAANNDKLRDLQRDLARPKL